MDQLALRDEEKEESRGDSWYSGPRRLCECCCNSLRLGTIGLQVLEWILSLSYAWVTLYNPMHLCIVMFFKIGSSLQIGNTLLRPSYNFPPFHSSCLSNYTGGINSINDHVISWELDIFLFVRRISLWWNTLAIQWKGHLAKSKWSSLSLSYASQEKY